MHFTNKSAAVIDKNIEGNFLHSAAFITSVSSDCVKAVLMFAHFVAC